MAVDWSQFKPAQPPQQQPGVDWAQFKPVAAPEAAQPQADPMDAGLAAQAARNRAAVEDQGLGELLSDSFQRFGRGARDLGIQALDWMQPDAAPSSRPGDPNLAERAAFRIYETLTGAARGTGTALEALDDDIGNLATEFLGGPVLDKGLLGYTGTLLREAGEWAQEPAQAARDAENARRIAAGLPTLEEETARQGTTIAGNLIRRVTDAGYNELLSDTGKLADKEAEAAVKAGFVPAIEYMARNPLTAASTLGAPSIPSIALALGTGGATGSARAAIASGVGLEGMSAGDQAEQAVLNTPAEQLGAEYAERVAAGEDAAQVRMELARRAGDAARGGALAMTGAAGFGGRRVTQALGLDQVEDIVARGGIAGTRGRIANSALTGGIEAVSEFPEELAAAVANNAAAVDVGMKGLGEVFDKEAFGQAAVGLGLGGAIGAGTGALATPGQPQPQQRGQESNADPTPAAAVQPRPTVPGDTPVADEAAADDILSALMAAGIEPPPIPEQGGNPSPAAPAAGSQPGAVVSPINQPAPSPSAESSERAQQVQAVTGQAVPRDGVQAGAIIDRRIAELQAATQRGRVPNAPELQAELDELQAMLREQDAKLAQGINLAPADRLTREERQTAEGRIVELRQQLEANRTATSAGYKLAELQRKLDRIDTDAGLIQLSQELSPLAPDDDLARMFDLPPEAPAAAPAPAAQVQPQAPAAPQAPAQAAAPAAAPAPPMSASPAAVTSWMKDALRRRGLTDKAIDRMTAERAMAEINKPWPKNAPAQPFPAEDAPLGAQFGEQPAPAPAAPAAPAVEQTFDVDVDYTKRKPKKKSASLKPVDATGKPRSLLDWIAHGDGLDRNTFARELGIDPRELGRRAAGQPIFRARKPNDPDVPVGMTPDEFREWLQTNDYVPRDQDDRPAEFSVDDAMDMFDRAFRGGQDVFSYDQLPAVKAWQAARRGEVEQDSQGDDAPAEPIIERLPEAVQEAIAAGVPEEAALDAWNRSTFIDDFDARIRALIDEAGNEDFRGAESGGREADSEGLRASGEDQGESRGDDGEAAGREVDEVRPDAADAESEALDRSFDDQAPRRDYGDEIPFQRREAASASGIPAGLPATQTDATRVLAGKLNRYFAERARRAGRRAPAELRFREIDPASLPDAVRRALAALGEATGTRVVVVRNLTPEVDKFNGVSFGDGVIYIDENADRPAVLTAAHEWIHQLRRDDSEAYQRLEDEVRRQGDMPAWIARMAAEGNKTDMDGATEELVADAVADAMIDPAFLRRVVEEGGALRRAARSFLRFLDGMLARVRGRNTAAYMRDVQAFRDELAAVLREFQPRFKAPTDADLEARAAELPPETPSFQQRDDEGLDFDFGNLDDVPDLDFDIAGELGDSEGARASTDTPAFRLWFRRSRVVDSNGDPLVVYHGTGEEFDAFDEGRLSRGTGHASSGLGFYFTPDRRSAKGYAEKASGGVPANENLLELYLSVQNPYRMTLREAQAFESAADSARRRRELQAQGYDGVHIPEQNAWVAFRSNQVKRTDNLGTWNPSDDRMRYQRRAAASGDLFARPTQAEEVRAEQERRDAQRNGRTGTGRTDMMAGPGDLFAGPRPEQADIEDGGIEAEARGIGTRAALDALAEYQRGDIDADTLRMLLDSQRETQASRESRLRAPTPTGDAYADTKARWDFEVRRSGRARAMEMAGETMAGFITGREFGETAESFIARTPRARALRDWIAEQRRGGEQRGMFQRRLTGDVFDSALLKSVEEGKGAPKRGTAEQWKGWLDGAVRRGEFKQSERDWLDVDGWLQRQGGNVTRDALAEYVRANQVELEEVRLGDGGVASARRTLEQAGYRIEGTGQRARLIGPDGDDRMSRAPASVLEAFAAIVEAPQGAAALPPGWTVVENEDGDGFELLDEQGIMRGEGATREEAIEDGQDRDERVDANIDQLPKFGQYQLPGGTNYREVLLTLPIAKRDGFAEYLAAYRARFPSATTTDEEVREFHSRGVPVPPEGRTVVQRQADSPVYQSSHWDQPNVLAHVRMNDRTDAQGREVLFVEEIQSDWHQAGRKKGYRDADGIKLNEAKKEYEALMQRMMAVGISRLSPAERARIEELKPIIRGQGRSDDMVPDAPLKGTDEWAMLAFKRVVREAVERGKSVIAWTTGDQQAERYDLSKQVDRIAYAKTESGTFNIQVFRGGENVLNRFGVSDTDAESLVGKEIVQKMNDGVGEVNFATGYRELSGLNLKIGGDGMRSFYDRILPAAVNKWAKKFGGRVSDVEVATETSGFDYDGLPQKRLPARTKAHALEITPAMREAASGPMPLFQRRSVPQARAEAAAKRATADTALGNPMNGGALGWNPVKAKWEGSRAAMRKAREATQDKFISLRDLQQDIEAATGQQLDDLQNVYRLENLMHGRVQDGILGIERQHLEPLFEAMRRAGVEAAELEEYLEARHAEERNKRIAAINPGMPDGGSGLTTAEARAILARSDRAKLEPLARRIDAITADTRRRLLASGVLTQEQFDAMEATYDFYVPLRGIDDSEQMAEADRGGGIGRGIEQRGSGIKRAAGRGAGNRAVNILGEVIADAQRAVIAAEKARVGRGLARLVLANPNPSLWELEAVRTERKFDAQGNVYHAVVNESAEPDVVHVLVKGKPYRVRIANPHVVQALKNLGANELHKLLRPLAALNRYVSATLTSYNPGFIAVNLARDATFGTVRVLAEHGPAAYASTVAGYGPAVKALAVHEAKGRGTGKMDQRLREFLGAGGKTGWVSMNAVEDLQRGVWIDTSGKLTARGLRGLRSLGRFVESANVVVENAMRLSYFNALRDNGLSVEQAAEKAKNLTVNFNRKGQWGNALSTAYLFFNPAIQGTHQVVKLAKNPKAVAAVATMTAAQVVLAMLAAGIEDEDGETLADKVPEYVKERNLWAVIPGKRDPMGKLLPGEQDRIVTLPMPFGFNAVTYAGSVGVDVVTRDMSEIASGARSPIGVAASVVGRLTNAFVGATSPVPINDGMAGLIPTIPGQIVAGLISNRDSLGRTIAQPQFDANNPEPLAYNARPETPAAFVELAKGLNWLGGGDEVRRPLAPLDWAPEQLEYLWEWAVGGAGRFFGEVVSGGYNLLADPEALENKPAPIVKAFTQPLNEGGATLGAYYDRVQAIEEQERRIRGIAKAQGIDAAIQYADTVPYMAGVVIKERSDGSVEIRPGGSDLYDAYRKAQRQLKELRTEERAIYAEEGRAILNADRARRLREIRERRVEAVKDVNLYWNEAVKPLQE